MPKIDLSMIGKKNDPVVFEYTWKNVVLYVLSIGETERELSLVYEHAPGGLKVLPGLSISISGRAGTVVTLGQGLKS